MSQTSSIVLRSVYKEYRRDEFVIPVLADLDLEVAEGEYLALMGPSGSGKTTLLNLVAGLDRSTKGEVTVHGQVLGHLSEAEVTRWRANNVGFIFQTYNLIPVLTAFENVELPLLLTSLTRRKRREHVMTALRNRRPREARAPLSSPALRRPGAAGRDRPGNRHRSLLAGRRRANRGPRPDHRRRDPRPARAAQSRVSEDDRHGHPRSAGRGPGQPGPAPRQGPSRG